METQEAPVIDWDAIDMDSLPLCKIDDPSCESCQ
jgi:hypothetical protein